MNHAESLEEKKQQGPELRKIREPDRFYHALRQRPILNPNGQKRRRDRICEEKVLEKDRLFGSDREHGLRRPQQLQSRLPKESIHQKNELMN